MKEALKTTYYLLALIGVFLISSNTLITLGAGIAVLNGDRCNTKINRKIEYFFPGDRIACYLFSDFSQEEPIVYVTTEEVRAKLNYLKCMQANPDDISVCGEYP